MNLDDFTKALKEQEERGEIEVEYDPGEEEEVNNLNEALSLLEDCHALFTACADPLSWTKGRPTAHLKRSLKKLGEEVESLLAEYGMIDY